MIAPRYCHAKMWLRSELVDVRSRCLSLVQSHLPMQHDIYFRGTVNPAHFKIHLLNEPHHVRRASERTVMLKLERGLGNS
jgi:hypothetical protein